MIYGHPKASDGICKEMIDNLEEMNAIIENHP